MKKVITFVITICLLLAMVIPVAAVSPGGIDWGAAEDSKNQAVQDMLEGRTITYDYNGGWRIELDGWRARITTGAAHEANGTHIIPDIIPWRFGCRFVGWQLPGGSMIYHPGDKLQGSGDVRLMALWEAAK